MAQMDNEGNNNHDNEAQHEGKDNDDGGMKEQNKQRKKIVLKVMLLGDEDPLRVKVKTSTAWSKIFQSFGDYKGREVRFLRFCYDGQRIQPNQTVGDIIDDVEEEDEEVQIDVMYEQQGGSP
eukprot:CAMPEP_0197020408 /NCGR_PEP_ID=MMETSP1384-20130603/1170_1 /TAXON_ID=29189 /ORGANISM="Ammonia sp." /LENGTH=121 /DNA_ID=CAMNT_0042448019 /DNA_START=92 /DNA_END=457 /DNA_ORIENTATION=+